MLAKPEDFTRHDRPDMFVSDAFNYLGVWLRKANTKQAAYEKLNSLTLSESEHVMLFQVDNVDESVTNQKIFEGWYKQLLSKKQLPEKVVLQSDAEQMHDVSYSMPLGDEWVFTENPLDSEWVGGSKFLGRVQITPPVDTTN
eukprot:Protomagalhaensia_wolfi_Nauph_80__313@NODE_1174_length_1679_cov_172_550610_g898_i0_p1_GENE_NODE_1174_length_1679_cov_172_550610_g898_i0NODE_1174_length_1679_cov_172_550610_g898_i0_p1_ORF_typecomplete_len142_score30_02DUF685/PF05085_12/0_06VIR_N/PF15912_5/0_13_NODE_1174_length_1679_cov_172_550610_g898_i09111336